jgi:hypothetical protein
VPVSTVREVLSALGITADPASALAG